MSDLRPYICISRDCAQAEKTYASRMDLIYHLECHASEYATFVDLDCFRRYAVAQDEWECPICQEKLLNVTSNERGGHVGRHMEETAFLVVSKPYEEWEFYSDSSRGRHAPEFGTSANRYTSGERVSEKEWDLAPYSYHVGASAEPSLNRTSPGGRTFAGSRISEGLGIYSQFPGRVFFDDPLRSPSIPKARLGTTGPYWCTFVSCSKIFRFKDDWKSHEYTQHYQIESWRCHDSHLQIPGFDCARVFSFKEDFQRHLKARHSIDDDAVRRHCQAYRIGRNCEIRFWCGFCQRLVDLHKKGSKAWDERADHIESFHFDNGQTMQDWRPVGVPMPRRDFSDSL